MDGVHATVVIYNGPESKKVLVVIDSTTMDKPKFVSLVRANWMNATEVTEEGNVLFEVNSPLIIKLFGPFVGTKVVLVEIPGDSEQRFCTEYQWDRLMEKRSHAIGPKIKELAKARAAAQSGSAKE